MLVRGDLRPLLQPLIDEGAFFVMNTETGTAMAQAPIRHVSVADGQTVLRFENRERRNGVDFIAGQTLLAVHPFPYGNLRDSDPERSIFTFGDAAYGRRHGQPYPLWNWCVLFSRFSIEDAP